MATNPDLNIVDTLDNATIGQLQQAQQLASSTGNTALSAIIGNAITFALASTGGSGGTGDGTGGPLPGIIPVNPPSTTEQGGFDVPITTVPGITPQRGGGTGITTGGSTTPGTGIIGFDRTGTTPSTSGTSGTGGRIGTDPCANPTYRIGTIKELNISLTGFGDLVNQDFNDLRVSKGARRCVLIAEVFKCCSYGETRVGWVEFGQATLSFTYEECPNGYKPVIKQYYDLDTVGLGIFVQPTLDALGNNLVTDSRSGLPNLELVRWSDQCNVGGSPTIYQSFDQYFNAKFANGLTIDNKSYPASKVSVYRDANIGSSKTSGTTIERSVPASCNYEGDCISTPPPTTPDSPCPPDGFFVNGISKNIIESQYAAENAKAIAAGYTRRTDLDQQYKQIDVQFNASQEYTPIPGDPCFEAQKTTVVSVEVAAFAYTITYRPGCDETQYIGVTRTREIENRYGPKRRIESKINSPECKCEEQLIDAGVLLDPNDPCGCKQYNLVKVRLKCPDGTETDSTEIYRDGIPVGLNLPAGHKLDPYVPFSLRADCKDEPIKIYHPLILGKDIVEAKVTSNTRGLFNLEQTMSCYLTSSLQSTASKEYYYEVTNCDCYSTPYFAVSYGNVKGSGSLWSVGETNDTATRAIYSQYRLLALEEPERKFKFYNNGTSSESDDIYAINFYRNALSDRIDPGNFEVALRPLNGGAYANNVHTGSNVQPSGSTIYTFIDNSGDRSDLAFCSEDPYVSYDIVSGSLDNGIHDSGTGSISTNPNITTYGKFYPNLGVMIFDPSKMNTLLGFNTVTGSNIAGDNAFKLYTSISGSGNLNSHMKARNVKFKTTNHYFVRVSPPNANYSNNPTFVSDTSTGKLLNTCFQKEPVTYVTSVGLYNDRRELLAIAKLSKPIKKTPDDDLLIKIRLNW